MEWLRGVINPYIPAGMLAKNFYDKQRALVSNRDYWRDNRDWEERQPKAQKEIKQLAVPIMMGIKQFQQVPDDQKHISSQVLPQTKKAEKLQSQGQFSGNLT